MEVVQRVRERKGGRQSGRGGVGEKEVGAAVLPELSPQTHRKLTLICRAP